MTHVHRPEAGTEVFAYSRPVAEPQNRLAHGGVCLRETCACGATRPVNANGAHREYGPWAKPAKVGA